MIHVNSEVRSFFVSFGYMKNVSRNSNNLTKTKNIFKINLKGGIPKRKSLVLKLPDVKLNNYFNQILNRQRFEVSVSIFNSDSYIECLTCYVVVCLQGGKKVHLSSTKRKYPFGFFLRILIAFSTISVREGSMDGSRSNS